jgi:hypothetical protein
MAEQSIEIDCAPMTSRPDTYIEGVIEGTGLTSREPISKQFGNYKWDFSEVPEPKWLEVKPIIAERITALYNSGRIRYGSW